MPLFRLGPDGARTVMVDAALRPSIVAETDAVPAATPRTSPALVTVATAALDVLQATVAPLITCPCASRGVAASCTVALTSIDAAGGATATVTASGRSTVTVDVPALPSLVAVMVTLPVVTGVTTPALDTVASALLDDVQLIARPVSVLPCASRVVAASVRVLPMRT